jgi:hypothetical protein
MNKKDVVTVYLEIVSYLLSGSTDANKQIHVKNGLVTAGIPMALTSPVE